MPQPRPPPLDPTCRAHRKDLPTGQSAGVCGPLGYGNPRCGVAAVPRLAFVAVEVVSEPWWCIQDDGVAVGRCVGGPVGEEVVVRIAVSGEECPRLAHNACCGFAVVTQDEVSHVGDVRV